MNKMTTRTRTSTLLIRAQHALFSLTLLGSALTSAAPGAITVTEYASTFRLLGLMAHTTFSPAEQAAVVTLTTAQFRTDLPRIHKNLKINAATLNTVLAMKNPVAQAELLRQYFVSSYWDNRTTPDPGFSLMFKHRPVLAADARTRFVVTAADLQALFANNDFVAHLAGVKPSTAAARQTQTSSLVQEFTSLGQASQRRINCALTYQLAITRAWEQGTPGLRSAMTKFARQRVHAQSGVPKGTDTFEQVAYRAWLSGKVQQAGSRSVNQIAQDNMAIMRMGMLANQFTMLSSQADH